MNEPRTTSEQREQRLKSRTYTALGELGVYAPTWCARLAWCERSERGRRS